MIFASYFCSVWSYWVSTGERYCARLQLRLQCFAYKSSTTASGLRVPFSMLLFCLVSTSLSAPCPLKGHSSCQLVFHQWNVSPILCCLSSREGIVHLRRGLRPLREYHIGVTVQWHWESPLLWFRDWHVAVVREHPCGRYCRQPTPE